MANLSRGGISAAGAAVGGPRSLPALARSTQFSGHHVWRPRSSSPLGERRLTTSRARHRRPVCRPRPLPRPLRLYRCGASHDEALLQQLQRCACEPYNAPAHPPLWRRLWGARRSARPKPAASCRAPSGCSSASRATTRRSTSAAPARSASASSSTSANPAPARPSSRSTRPPRSPPPPSPSPTCSRRTSASGSCPRAARRRRRRAPTPSSASFCASRARAPTPTPRDPSTPSCSCMSSPPAPRRPLGRPAAAAHPPDADALPAAAPRAALPPRAHARVAAGAVAARAYPRRARDQRHSAATAALDGCPAAVQRAAAAASTFSRRRRRGRARRSRRAPRSEAGERRSHICMKIFLSVYEPSAAGSSPAAAPPPSAPRLPPPPPPPPPPRRGLGLGLRRLLRLQRGELLRRSFDHFGAEHQEAGVPAHVVVRLRDQPHVERRRAPRRRAPRLGRFAVASLALRRGASSAAGGAAPSPQARPPPPSMLPLASSASAAARAAPLLHHRFRLRDGGGERVLRRRLVNIMGANEHLEDLRPREAIFVQYVLGPLDLLDARREAAEASALLDVRRDARHRVPRLRQVEDDGVDRDSARPGYAQPSAQTSAWRHVT